MMNNTARRPPRFMLFALLLTTTALCAMPPCGWANLAPSGLVAESSANGAVRAADLKSIATALESKALRGRLKSLGFNEQEADARLAKLSDQEVHQLAVSLEAVQPGGIIVELLVVVALVLVVIYLVKRV